MQVLKRHDRDGEAVLLAFYNTCRCMSGSRERLFKFNLFVVDVFMPIRLRLALHGTRHRRIFHLVAIHRAQRRDAKPTETLGIYDPHMINGQTHKTIEWSVDRIRYWLHVGAVPSKSVSKLLEMASYRLLSCRLR